jgi:hypothetical protein
MDESERIRLKNLNAQHKHNKEKRETNTIKRAKQLKDKYVEDVTRVYGKIIKYNVNGQYYTKYVECVRCDKELEDNLKKL